MRIDAHQHFWNYSPAEYPWIGAGMERLARDFLPADLVAVASGQGVTGSVAVQARQSLEETRWLLRLADESPFIKGVVGWVDLRSGRAADEIAAFAEHEKFVGVRHVVQDEPDPRFLLGEEFVRGLKQLHGITNEARRCPHSIRERQSINLRSVAQGCSRTLEDRIDFQQNHGKMRATRRIAQFPPLREVPTRSG
jgi:L-fuconolactonase